MSVKHGGLSLRRDGTEGELSVGVENAKDIVVYICRVVCLFGLLCAISVTCFSMSLNHILLPAVATIVIFYVFAMTLKKRVGENLFGELGFIYIALIVAYTVIPALTFISINVDFASGWVWERLAELLPSQSELGKHLWRHVVFVFGVATGYLFARGRKVPKINIGIDNRDRDGSTIILLLFVAGASIFLLSSMSAPVETYIDNYTRYNHLAWFPRKITSIAVRMKFGVYTILLLFLFKNYNKYKFALPLIVACLCVFETVHSFGSRIESLTVLLEALCLYGFFVRPISLKKGIAVCFSIAVLFSVVEVFRSSRFNVNATRDVISQQGVTPAAEFGAVYFPGYHLYEERNRGTMPNAEWPMFFNDFISVVTFADFNRWNPQYWYARAYYPDAVVPPATIGPIADSAVWGGVGDLLVRGLVNGIFFAYIVRWFVSRCAKWWAMVIYVYCYATSVMALKYSVFYHLTPLIKTVLPALLLVYIFRQMMFAIPRRSLIDRTT